MEPLLLVIGLITGLVIGILFFTLLARPKESLPEPILKAFAEVASLKDLRDSLQEIRTKLEVGSVTQNDLKEKITQTHQTLESLRTDYEARKRQEEEAQATVKRLDSIIAGSYSKGRAGENILAEAFKTLPPDMVIHNFTVNGKVVEFGLVLANDKKLPIDSKWSATNLLLELEGEVDQSKRQRLAQAIEKEIEKRVREVSQYIDTNVTTPWALAAIPDSAFSICRTVHLEAHKRHVLLMSYSMAIPYLLALYRLHIQYSKSLDMENLQSRLVDINRNLDEMEQIFENKLARSGTMINNAYNECKQLLGNIKGAITYLQKAEETEQLGESDSEIRRQTSEVMGQKSDSMENSKS